MKLEGIGVRLCEEVPVSGGVFDVNNDGATMGLLEC